MVRREQAPNPAESVDELARDLWTLYDAQFGDDIDPAHYRADLVLPMRSDTRIYEDQGLQDYVQIMTGDRLAPQAPWEATIGYVPANDNLGLTLLALPLQRGQNKLLFHRVHRYGFIPMLQSGDVITPLVGEDQVMSPDAQVVQESFVEGLASRVGYKLTGFARDPRQTRLMVAGIMDKASATRLQETVTLPTDPDILLAVTRTLQKHTPAGTSTWHGSVKNIRDRSSRFRRQTTYGDLVSTDLTATMEFITRDAMHRRQVVVAFAGEGFAVDLPTIQVVDLEQNRVGLPNRSDPHAYGITDRTEVECDTIILDKLITATIDTVTGR